MRQWITLGSKPVKVSIVGFYGLNVVHVTFKLYFNTMLFIQHNQHDKHLNFTFHSFTHLFIKMSCRTLTWRRWWRAFGPFKQPRDSARVSMQVCVILSLSAYLFDKCFWSLRSIRSPRPCSLYLVHVFLIELNLLHSESAEPHESAPPAQPEWIYRNNEQ